jgi:hypothetical protein
MSALTRSCTRATRTWGAHGLIGDETKRNEEFERCWLPEVRFSPILTRLQVELMEGVNEGTVASVVPATYVQEKGMSMWIVFSLNNKLRWYVDLVSRVQGSKGLTRCLPINVRFWFKWEVAGRKAHLCIL